MEESRGTDVQNDERIYFNKIKRGYSLCSLMTVMEC